MSAFTVSAVAPALGVRASVGPARRGAPTRVSQAVPKGIGSVSLPTPRRGDALVTRNSAAADAGGMAEDPYKVLGVKEGTPGDELAKVINRKKLLYKTEPEKLKHGGRVRADRSGVPRRQAPR